MRRTLTILALATACAAAAGARPAAAQAEPAIALNIQPPAPHQADRVLSLLRAAGVRQVRASWWHWSSPESWRWAPAYRAAGIEVLPLVYPTADAGAEPGRAMAARYRALFDAFGSFPYVQLGNEVDGDGPYGIRGMDAARAYEQGRRWGAQLRAARALIHRFDPAVKIVAGGMAWVHPGTGAFLRGLAEVGGFDVLAIHTYGIGCAGEPLSRYREVRAAEWRGPIWNTELGTNHGHAAYVRRDPDRFQAEQLDRCLFQDPSRFGYERLYWFQLTPSEEGYGLLRPDFTPRPAFDRLRARRARP